MQKRKNDAKKLFFAGLTTFVVIFLLLAGCPNSTDDNGPKGPTGWTEGPFYENKAGLPQKPSITKMEDGYGFTNDVDLKNPGTPDAAKKKPVISLTWTGANTERYNIYWSDESIRPKTPKAPGLKDTVYFAEGLDPETRYYFWVEAVNKNGSAVSDARDRTTRLDNDVERGDYPRNIRMEPDNGQLTVWWDLSDRVGWYEVYYAPVGTITHVDAYTPTSFPKGASDPWAGHPYGTTQELYPWYTPLASPDYMGYQIGKIDGAYGSSNRPVLGVESFGTAGTTPRYPPAGAFPYIFEAWMEGDGANDLGKLQPYTPLHTSFANATPWDGTKNGTPGTPIRYYKNSVTITGLTNGTLYEVWIRCPNANGERGYGYIVGTPGAGSLPAPQGITVTAPADTTRDLEIKWNAVAGATGYRLYFSQYNETPSVTTEYTLVDDTGAANYTVTRNGLLPGTSYYVWVVAELNGVGGAKGASVSGKTGNAPAGGIKGKEKKIVGSENVVKTLMYVEVNDNNPLNAGSYILEDGSYLFDYVVLFASNIRTRNCALENAPHGCTKNGPHVHHNENNRHILTNASKYIKPLQDKGIKVLMCILPDHDGISLGSMDASQITIFVADLKRDIDLYGLDGVDLDDEWASKEDWDNWPNQTTPSPNSIWVYPNSTWYWPFNVTVYRNPAMGVVAGNGTTTANSSEDQARMWRELGAGTYKTLAAIRTALGPDKIVTVYEYNTGRYITPDAGGTNSQDPNVTNLGNILDFSLNPMYNQYLPDSANGLPHAKYGPLAIDVGGSAYDQGGTPLPPQQTTGTNSITDYATRYKTASDGGNPYGYICLYGLNPSTQLLKQANSSPTATVPKEDYLSIMTQIIFGQKTVLTAEGGDYRKDW
jgi:hypothetical protein